MRRTQAELRAEMRERAAAEAAAKKAAEVRVKSLQRATQVREPIPDFWKEIDPATTQLLTDEAMAKYAPEAISTAQEYLNHEMRNVYEYLREIADKVERIATRDDGWGGNGYKVQAIQHEVLWGVANLGLDKLTQRLNDLNECKARFGVDTSER